MFRNRTSPRPSLRSVALAAVCAVAPLAVAQRNPFAGGEVSSPWEALHLNPKARVKLDYRNANVDAILAMYQRASGVTIVKDPTLVGPLTLSSAKAVPLGDAFQILSTTLSLKGYDMRKQGDLLVIKKHQDDRGNGGFPNGGNGNGNGNGDQGPITQDQAILSVYPINYANASQIARVINDVFADSGTQNFGGFRGPFGEDLTNPVDVEAAIQGRGGFGGGQGGQGGGNRGGFGGFGGGQGGPGGNRGGFNFRGNGQATTLVKADYDDYSNQVIVSAPVRFQSQVKDIIKQLDKVTDTPVQTKVYHLNFASASDATTVVQNVLNANVPRGKGGATTGQTQGPQGFASALRGQTLGSGTVTSDLRTNNIVVTATPENVKIVDQVVKELDLNVPVSSTTFVFQLNNAKADDVATLLQSAFGTRTGVNGARTGQNTNTNNGNRTTTSVSAGQQNRNTNTGIRSEVVGNDLELAMKDPNAQSGELATSVGVTQGFGQNFLGGGQNNGGNRTGTATRTFGVDQNGQVVNTRDLSNQVTAIADTNTNSLIVVTSPENAAIIREILNQLDKIPEQVMIETVIVEASLTASDKLGVTFNTSNSSSSTTSGLSTNFTNVGAVASTTNDNQGFQYTVTGKNYGIFLNALKEDSKFQVLSSPRIFTSNNIQASINISQSIPYVTSQVENVTGTFTNQYQFLDVGIVLTVTPRITSNGFVSMDVVQTANDLQGYTSFNAPIVNQREADTRVSVQDGQTIILGGIIRKAVTTDVRKVPVLGDIPLLGQLFRSKTLENDKTELLVFLTPHIVRNADEAQRLRQQGVQKLSPESQKGFNDFQKTGNNDSQRDTNGNPKVLPVPTPTKSDPGKTTPPKTGGG